MMISIYLSKSAEKYPKILHIKTGERKLCIDLVWEHAGDAPGGEEGGGGRGAGEEQEGEQEEQEHEGRSGEWRGAGGRGLYRSLYMAWRLLLTSHGHTGHTS